jgi:hypothetical protein
MPHNSKNPQDLCLRHDTSCTFRISSQQAGLEIAPYRAVALAIGAAAVTGDGQGVARVRYPDATLSSEVIGLSARHATLIAANQDGLDYDVAVNITGKLPFETAPGIAIAVGDRLYADVNGRATNVSNTRPVGISVDSCDALSTVTNPYYVRVERF